jgi:hypothetical protein
MLRAKMQEEAKKILAKAPHLEEALQQDLDQSRRDSKNWVWFVVDYNRRSWPEANTQTDASVLNYMEIAKAMYVVTKAEKNPKSRQLAVNVWR